MLATRLSFPEIGDRPGRRIGPGRLCRSDVATALGYDVAAALEEPGDN
jgi:hypothetical protein